MEKKDIFLIILCCIISISIISNILEFYTGDDEDKKDKKKRKNIYAKLDRILELIEQDNKGNQNSTSANPYTQINVI
ncbi:hypothetical protein H8356DRAFT_956594 [Neocallimastix lanati (nom. inval.)]|uniref:Uncharacterized protein n=1 Tax=Neocallimastix californiae TaxID=1754190 RepID=A0A1Y2AXU2_9FUNG|nr:hypothetical protein H8356DRAFT_956594 [Neocallimastix sp. JGI-2020a]ORY27382.1 hypothetical protein LY90DRAFT_705892 [Neocallimastix californiae]|eukprot:ORY27382.1 hypothetical protein LY90DRAFT_705892 [Neocallimastix californiae]